MLIPCCCWCLPMHCWGEGSKMISCQFWQLFSSTILVLIAILLIYSWSLSKSKPPCILKALVIFKHAIFPSFPMDPGILLFSSDRYCITPAKTILSSPSANFYFKPLVCMCCCECCVNSIFFNKNYFFNLVSSYLQIKFSL